MTPNRQYEPTVGELEGPMKNPAQTGKSKRDKHFWEWAWVDSNYRPHASEKRAHGFFP
jgi:hypothetical protein